MVHRLLSATLIAMLVGCGASPSGPETTPSPTPRPKTVVPSMPPAPNSAAVLPTIQRDVMLAYQDMKTLKVAYDNEQHKGNETYRATAILRYAKPRKVRVDVKTCTDSLVAGASILWTGGSTLKARKQVGPLTLNQEHTLPEKACLRGWTFDQTDYHAMVQALTAGISQAKVTGWQEIDGKNLLMIEFPSTLKGASIERVGLDPALRLPVYRAIMERGGTQPIFVTRYSQLQPNADLGKDAFSF